ncbi:hypothetical protein FOZ62_001351, partial [Perkinsus olseni]
VLKTMVKETEGITITQTQWSQVLQNQSLSHLPEGERQMQRSILRMGEAMEASTRATQKTVAELARLTTAGSFRRPNGKGKGGGGGQVVCYNCGEEGEGWRKEVPPEPDPPTDRLARLYDKLNDMYNSVSTCASSADEEARGPLMAEELPRVATEVVLDDNECYRLVFRESSKRYEVYVKQSPNRVRYQHHGYKLPMGWVHSSRILAQVVNHALPSRPTTKKFARKIYADNLCYVGWPQDHEATVKAMAEDRQDLGERGMLIKDTAVEWLADDAPLTILGYELRKENGTVTLYTRPKSLPQPLVRRDLLRTNGHAYDELYITGIGGYKAMLASLAMAGVPADRKKQYMRLPLERGVKSLSSRIRGDIEVAQRKGVQWVPDAICDDPLVLYTDASNTGWGFNVMQDGHVLARGSGRWPKAQKLWGMPTKEAMAALRGLTATPTAWAEALPIKWKTDSATTLSALDKIARGGDAPAMNVTFRRRVAEIVDNLLS